MPSTYFENRDCEFFPCHANTDEMNCLFCYCPLYHMKDCPGTPSYLEDGTKDCSGCVFPHIHDNWRKIVHLLICKKDGDVK